MRCGIGRLKFAFNEGVALFTSSTKGRELLRTRLYTNSIFLIGNSGANAILSFAFWILVSRTYSVEDVGLGSAIISVVLLLSFIGSLGLGSGLIRFLPSIETSPPRLINSCFLVTSIAATAVAFVYLAGVSLFSPSMLFIRESVFLSTAFVIFVLIRAIFNLLTPVYVARRRAEYSFIQATAMGGIRIALALLVVGWLGAFGIFAAWGMATTLTCLVGVLVFLPRLVPGYRIHRTAAPKDIGQILSFSFANYISMGMWSMPIWLLPIIVLNFMGQQANGYFFIGWSIASHLFSIPISVSQSLFSEGSNYEHSLGQDVKRSLRFIIALMVPLVVAVVVFADKLLLVFGREYSAEGTQLLWILAISALPTSINLLYLSIARVKKRLISIIAVSTVIAVVTLGLSYILIPATGLLGPGIAWLVGNTLTAIFTLPGIIKAIREKDAGDTIPSVYAPGIQED